MPVTDGVIGMLDRMRDPKEPGVARGVAATADEPS